MNKAVFEHNGDNRRCYKNLRVLCFVLGLSAIVTQASGETLESPLSSRGHIENAIVVTQLPVTHPMPHQPTGTAIQQQESLAHWPLRVNLGEGARLVKVNPDFSTEVLSHGFHSACDPEISFDAPRILFAGKRKHTDTWNIFEMAIDGSGIRQVTYGESDCRSPCYQPPLYMIASPKPRSQTTFVRSEEVTESWADMIALRRQITFVGSQKGLLNEWPVMSATNLYSCKLDGTGLCRLTFNLSSNMDPFLMPNGRLLFASWQRSSLYRDLLGCISLFGINIDGTDYAAFSNNEGKRIKHMPCITTKGLVVFIEADRLQWDGAGSVGSVKLRRPLHSYRQITQESDGLFHSPSPLPDGRVLISRRSTDGMDTHSVYRLEPATGQLELIFDSPGYHDIQAKIVYPRPEPDGRSSVVTEEDPNGKLYCLNVYISDFNGPEWIPPGTVKRLRVLEGISSVENTPVVHPSSSTEVLTQRRILGEIDIAEDGSFNIEIPADTPIKLQILDADGMALRSCDWIWAQNHEPRGCIGCHEDGELTPENILVKALTRPSINLTLPAGKRRTVDFRRDVMPIIEKKCVQCHDQDNLAPHLTRNLSLITSADGKAYYNRSYESLLISGSRPDHGKYVHPGSARLSPLIWNIFGRNTSRPWDDTFSEKKVTQMPPNGNQALTRDEKRTFIEWIDMGALWDGIPGPDNLPGYKQNNGGGGE